MPRIPRVDPVDPQMVVGGVARVEPTPGQEPVVEPTGVEPTPAKVRSWAAENGIEVGSQGPVPKRLVEAYKAAHGG